jgi:hypothetical protein
LSCFCSFSTESVQHPEGGIVGEIQESGDVVAFQTNVLKHLQDTGMDAISYLPNPQDPTTMINVIENHSCYTVKTAIDASGQLLSKFNKYDLTNDKAAREFLLALLDSKLSMRYSQLLLIRQQFQPCPFLPCVDVNF